MVIMAFRECYNGAPGPRSSRYRATCSMRVSIPPCARPGRPHYRASTKIAGDPADVEQLADILVNSTRPCVLLGTQVWTAARAPLLSNCCRQLNIPAYMNGAGAGHLCARRPASFPSDSRLRLRESRHHRNHRYAVRLQNGIRAEAPRRRNRGADRSRLSHRGQKPRHLAGIVGDAGAILSAATQAASGRIDNGARRRDGWLSELREQENKSAEAMRPRLLSDASPIHPLRLAHEINQFLTENTIFIGDGGDVVTFSPSWAASARTRPGS